MTALVQNRPGVYTATLNAVALGVTTSEGFKLKYKPQRLNVDNTNLYGKTLVDGIHLGVGDVQLIGTFKEWNAGLQTLLWPWGTGTPPVMDGTIGLIGKRISDYALPIVLTAQAGSPAASLSYGGVANANTFTTALAILAPENDVEMLFGPVETDVPVLLDLLVYDDAGSKRVFKWSSV